MTDAPQKTTPSEAGEAGEDGEGGEGGEASVGGGEAVSSEDVKQKDKDKMATDASEQQQSTSTAKPSAQGRHDESSYCYGFMR